MLTVRKTKIALIAIRKSGCKPIPDTRHRCFAITKQHATPIHDRYVPGKSIPLFSKIEFGNGRHVVIWKKKE